MTNPMAGNPIATRQDVTRALIDLSKPMSAGFSDGRGRLRLSVAGAHFAEAAADLEGLARPLWGLAPLVAGGGAFEDIDLYVEGLANGADPIHADFWGQISDCDQRIVESAAIGFALALAPEMFWDKLPDRGRDNLAQWLLGTLERAPAPNNWHFFHVLVSLGLDRVGVAYDRTIIEGDLDFLEGCYMGNGWYRDGPGRRAEHYIPFAMHMYGLIYAALATGDEERCARFRDRAARFAPQIRHWYAPDGAALPYGRSLTYRFAHSGFWGALALADLEALSWSEIRGYWARNLRYWSRQPMADRDGVLPVGYCYPNLLMSEAYNSAGSPYWAFKAFLPLALPEDHVFWQADEAEPPEPDAHPVQLKEPGMIKWTDRQSLTVLAGGQEAFPIRQAAEKYNKFAYSTRYGFSVESDPRSFPTGPFDSTLAFSDDGIHYRVRSSESDARIGQDFLFSRWSPMDGVDVQTWLLADPPWHLRIHRVVTDRRVMTREGGFALPRTDAPLVECEPAEPANRRDAQETDVTRRVAVAVTVGDVSVIHDIGETPRAARVLQADPNTNLIFPRSWVPQLSVQLGPGTHWLASAVAALADGRAALQNVPGLPGSDALRRMAEADVIPVWSI